MKQHDYLQLSGAVFLVIAFVHVLRLAMGWEVVVNGVEVPQWVSGIGVVVGGLLGYFAFKSKK